jgi:hypothetical protein
MTVIVPPVLTKPKLVPQSPNSFGHSATLPIDAESWRPDGALGYVTVVVPKAFKMRIDEKTLIEFGIGTYYAPTKVTVHKTTLTANENPNLGPTMKDIEYVVNVAGDDESEMFIALRVNGVKHSGYQMVPLPVRASEPVADTLGSSNIPITADLVQAVVAELGRQGYTINPPRAKRARKAAA